MSGVAEGCGKGGEMDVEERWSVLQSLWVIVTYLVSQLPRCSSNTIFQFHNTKSNWGEGEAVGGRDERQATTRIESRQFKCNSVAKSICGRLFRFHPCSRQSLMYILWLGRKSFKTSSDSLVSYLFLLHLLSIA